MLVLRMLVLLLLMLLLMPVRFRLLHLVTVPSVFYNPFRVGCAPSRGPRRLRVGCASVAPEVLGPRGHGVHLQG